MLQVTMPGLCGADDQDCIHAKQVLWDTLPNSLIPSEFEPMIVEPLLASFKTMKTTGYKS